MTNLNLCEAQIQVNTNTNALTLANRLMGAGARVESAILNCNSNSSGIVTNTGAGIGSGVLLSTGSIQSVANPASFILNTNNAFPSIPILDSLANTTTEDGCTLEMEVVPVCTKLAIKYSFASEEYPEFVGRYYYDAFAFLVSGPNPNGANYITKNIATVPGTSDLVGVGSVNNGTYNTGPCLNCNYYVNNLNSTSFAFDGYTLPILASIDVVPCEHYFLKFVLADVRDGNYDSGVLLENAGISCNLPVPIIVSKDSICKGQFVNLTSSLVGDAYSWSNGDIGKTATVFPNVTTIYTLAYTSCGNTVYSTHKIVVLTDSGTSYHLTSDKLCLGDANVVPIMMNGTGIFTSSSGLILLDTITGTIDLVNSIVGNHLLYFSTTGMCPISNSRKVSVFNKPRAIMYGGGSYCEDELAPPIILNINGIPPYNYKIDVGSSQITGIQSLDSFNLGTTLSGIYLINKITDGSGCVAIKRGSVSLTKKLIPKVSSNISGLYCSNQMPSQLTLNFTGVPPFNFKLITPNSTHHVQLNTYTYTFLNPGIGIYMIDSLIDSNQCDSPMSTTINLKIITAPIASTRTDTTVCEGSTLQLIGFNQENSIWVSSTKVLLDSAKEITINPISTDTYGYVVIDKFNCSDTDWVKVSVFPKPLIAFSQQKTCAGDSLRLINQTQSDSSIQVLNYKWTAENGIVSNRKNPSFYFDSCGTHSINLSVTTTNFCVYEKTQNMKIVCTPLADFSVSHSAICGGDSVYIVNNSSSSNFSHAIVSIDNIQQNSFSKSTSLVINEEGSYQVLLKAVGEMGCADSVIKNLRVNEKPKTNFFINSTCSGTTSKAFNTSRSNNAQFYRKFWDVENDGTIEDTITSPLLLFKKTGNIPVKLKLISSMGCSDSILKYVTVNPVPKSNFSYTSACEQSKIIFKNSTLFSNDQSTLRHHWVLNGNEFSFAENGEYIFLNDSTYKITLLSTSQEGCVDSISKMIKVLPKPHALATLSTFIGCEPLAVNLQNLSYVNYPSYIKSFNWSIDSVNSYRLPNPKLNFKKGVYHVKLETTTTDGCKDTFLIERALTVNPLPDTKFNIDPEEISLLLNNVRISTEIDTTAAVRNWLLDRNIWNVTYESNTNLDASISDTGWFDIGLTSVSNYGCVDTTFKKIFVKWDYALYIPNSFSPNADGLNDVFLPEGLALEGVQNYSLKILNRWNNVLFESRSINEGWNGSVENIGDMVPGDIYNYEMEFKEINGAHRLFKGKISVVK